MIGLAALVLVLGAGVQGTPAGDVAEFTRLETQWMDALAAKDEATLQALVAPEFSIVGAGSTPAAITSDRASWMRVAMLRPFPRHEVSRLRVTRVGDVAIVQFLLTGTYPPRSLTQEGGKLEFMTTDVWSRRNDRWQVVTRHSSLALPPVVR